MVMLKLTELKDTGNWDNNQQCRWGRENERLDRRKVKIEKEGEIQKKKIQMGESER